MSSNIENYKQCQDLLDNLDLEIGDLEDYFFATTNRNMIIIGLFSLFIACTPIVFAAMLLNIDISAIAMVLVVILGIALLALRFSMKYFLPALCPYKRSDVSKSLYILNRNLTTSEARTMAFLNKVVKFKNAR